MILFTVFCVIDGSCDGVFLAPTESRFSKDFGVDFARKNFELVSKHSIPADPADYRLLRIGDFDTATGVVTPCDPPVEVPYTVPVIK